MPKVSIVLPTYNGERFIRDSINSIINQTFQDWELLIVNDCSTDGTYNIISKYEHMDYRIRVINNSENQKLPKALNIGFQNASGDYLTWTSDDNMYLPEALEKMVEFMDYNPKEYIVCSRMSFISEEGGFQYISRDYTNEFMCYSNCVGACFLYRKEVLTEIGWYDPNYFLVEDYEYWLRILFKYKNIGFIKEVLYLYRNQNESLTATRMNEIQYNISKLRIQYIHDIAYGLRKRKDLLCKLYFETCKFYQNIDLLKDTVSSYVREIEMDDDSEMMDNVIVYGAGTIGKKFANTYSERIFCYADKSKKKVGTYIGNKKVIDINEIGKLSNNYQIVVASGIEKIYDFLHTLKRLGIKKCFVYKEEW